MDLGFRSNAQKKYKYFLFSYSAVLVWGIVRKEDIFIPYRWFYVYIYIYTLVWKSKIKAVSLHWNVFSVQCDVKGIFLV